MNNEKKTYYKTFGLNKISKDFLDKQELHQLYKKPKKDNRINTPHIQVFENNYKQQADLLFLPDDGGFKYSLVVVDLGSRITDAEPLKEKTSVATTNTFEKIYKRNIIGLPKMIQ
eukprot:gene10285-12620_t